MTARVGAKRARPDFNLLEVTEKAVDKGFHRDESRHSIKLFSPVQTIP